MRHNRTEITKLTKKISDREFDKQFYKILEKSRSLALNTQPFSNDEKEKERRLAKAESNFNYFCKTYMPHYFDQDWADFQKKDWHKIIKDNSDPHVLQAMREAGKSSYFGVANFLHKICFKKKNYLISVGYNEAKSVMTPAFVKVELMFNARIKADFGDLLDGALFDAYDYYVTKTDICVQAVSVGQDPRGLRWRNYRPDLVIADDVQEKRRVKKNKKYVAEVVNWFLEDLLPALSEDAWLCLLGTPMASRCVVNTLAKKEGWKSHRFTPIDKKGNLTFVSKYPKARLEKLRKKMGKTAFNQEILLVVNDDDSTFQEEWIKTYHPEEILNTPGLVVSWFDPSAKQNEQNCYKAIITLKFVYGIAYVLNAWIKHASLDRAIRHHFSLYEEYNHAYMWFEDNGFQSTLLGTFQKEAKEQGFSVPVKGITNTANKIERITMTLQSAIETGVIRFNPADSDQALLIEQIVDFPGEFVDGPDALEGAYRYGIKKRKKSSNWRAASV